jgi:predicted RNA methylase
MTIKTSVSARTRLKRGVKRPLIALVAHLPESVQRVLFVPRVRRVAGHIPILRGVYSGCFRRHPIDLQHGTETSGLVDADRLQPDAALTNELNPYMGSQPSIVRRALLTLGETKGYTFVDIGCGKGRAMIVATEFDFDAIVGYDISAELVNIANENAAVMAQRYPERTPIRALKANVSELSLPVGKLVVFLYNPFGTPLIAALLKTLEAGIAAGEIEHLFIVYDNPVCGHVFDASRAVTRWFAGAYPYEHGEIGYGPLDEEAVVIWQSVRGARPYEFSDRGRAIRVKDRLQASLD